jgi:hypothetical protein
MLSVIQLNGSVPKVTAPSSTKHLLQFHSLAELKQRIGFSFNLIHGTPMRRRRHDSRHNDTQHNDNQHKNTQNKKERSASSHVILICRLCRVWCMLTVRMNVVLLSVVEVRVAARLRPQTKVAFDASTQN